MDSFADTKLQRKIINDRLDVVSFSTDSLVNSYTEELSLLETILETETNLLHGYLMYLHQNRLLLGYMRISPWMKKKTNLKLVITGFGDQ